MIVHVQSLSPNEFNSNVSCAFTSYSVRHLAIKDIISEFLALPLSSIHLSPSICFSLYITEWICK
jgi:hypothetical protein